MASIYEFMEAKNLLSATRTSVTIDLEVLNDKIMRTLMDLGLTDDEAKALIFLNKKGAMKVQEIAGNVDIPRTRLYYVLESLQSKGLVTSTMERPARFKALPLDKAADFLVNSYRQKLYSMENAREDISHDWSLLQEHEVIRNAELEPEENLQIISGEDQIFSKAKSMLMQGANEVNVFVNAKNLAKISDADVTNMLQLLASRGTSVKILTNITSCNGLLKEINRCEAREIPAHFSDKVNFIIVDGKELLLLNLGKVGEPSAMYTDSNSVVKAMSFIFQIGWH